MRVLIASRLKDTRRAHTGGESMLAKIIVIAGCVIAAAFFGWICAAIGKKAGYRGTYFFILGFFTGVIGIVITTIIYFVAKRKARRDWESRQVSPAYSGIEDNPALTYQGLREQQPPSPQNPESQRPSADEWK
jgi:Na+/melibiose symporter-like transporter